MNLLLDTNVVSEWTRPRPDAGVISWLANADEDRTFLSVIAIAELRHGIERLPPGARRERLDDWLTEELPLRFEKRLLDVDAETANVWGRLMARGQAAGRPPNSMDVFIAATVVRHDMTLVTRNVADFESLGIKLVNPWTTG